MVQKRTLQRIGRLAPTISLWAMAAAYGLSADTGSSVVAVLISLGVTPVLFEVTAVISGVLIAVWKPIGGLNAFTALQYLLLTFPLTIYVFATVWYTVAINPMFTKMPMLLYSCLICAGFIAYWLSVGDE